MFQFSLSGPLADSNVVRNAIRKDSSLEGRLSYENIFKFVRMDIEEFLVDRLQAEVKFALQVRSVADPGCFTGFRIPDPTFFHPGSEFFHRGSGSRIRVKKFKYFNKKNGYKL
jgi:hypothetical protein